MILHEKLAVLFKEEMATVKVENLSQSNAPKKPKKPKIGIVPVLKFKKGFPIIKNKIRLVKMCCLWHCYATCPLLKPKQCDCKRQCPDCEGGALNSLEINNVLMTLCNENKNKIR